ncbi:MAG: PaaI family thioesterase [Granulosicoccus sp.]
MSDNAPTRVDEKAARAHLDTVLSDHVQAFETFFLAKFLNLSFEYLPLESIDAEKEICRVSFPMSDMLKNPQGLLHGGVMATVLDISMGHLVNKVAGPGATIEMKVQYMRPVSEGIVTVEGRFTRRGRTLAFMESRLSDANGKLSALATATWKMP